MSVSSIPVMCYYNGHIVRTDNDVKYDGNKASIVPLEIPVDCTFEQLGDIIFASTPIDKRKFNLVLRCKYPLKCGNRFQPFTIWNDRSVHLMLNMVNTTAIEEIELFVEVVRIHQEFVVVASSKKLLVLRCKKAEECQCQWKLRAMVVKETSLFVINKYEGPHTCVNPCLNRDHHQLDSKLVATHIQAIIKAQFTLSPAAIQASVMEKWGYEISYKKALDGKHKAFRHLFGDFT